MDEGRIKKLKKIFGKNVIAFFYRSLWFLSDKSFIELIYRLRMGKRLNLDNPKTFTEKLQWLKLYDHNPMYTIMADKIGMRRFVEERLGCGYTVPLVGVYDGFKEIGLEKLPSQFVMKTSHDSGSYIVCRDKAAFDFKAARKAMTRSLRRNYYKRTREWQYKDIVPKIVVEEFLSDGNEALTDYKFFCFNGKCEFLYIMPDTDRSSPQAILDAEFRKLPFGMEDNPASSMPEKPSCFEEMKRIAQVLSHGIPFLRVDMYLVNGKVYVGELTFYHYGGYIPFSPPEWDEKIGDLLDLDGVKGVER